MNWGGELGWREGELERGMRGEVSGGVPGASGDAVSCGLSQGDAVELLLAGEDC